MSHTREGATIVYEYVCMFLSKTIRIFGKLSLTYVNKMADNGEYLFSFLNLFISFYLIYTHANCTMNILYTTKHCCTKEYI